MPSAQALTSRQVPVTLLPVRVLHPCLRSAARWLAVTALVFHIAWLPLHLLTEAHCDAGPAHPHAQAHTEHHGHSHGESDTTPHGDTHHHHFTGDHESKFHSKRQAVLFAPVLAIWQKLELITFVVAVPLPETHPLTAPPPTDFSPPTGPRAPPLA